MALWTSVFVDLWKRQHAETAFKWDVTNYSQLFEPPRPAFYAVGEAINPVTDQPEK